MFRADTIVQITGQDSLPYDIGFLSVHTLVIDIDRAPVERNRAVVHHVDMLVANFLVQLIRENRGVLTVEIRLESMADRLVQ